MLRHVIPVVLIAAAACGGPPAATAGTAPAPAGASRGLAELITEAEIAKTAYSNALEIVQSLRPNMLRVRPTTLTPSNNAFGFPDIAAANAGVVVYFDDVRLGEVAQLSSIPTLRVREIRYINARDATTRWGTGHGAGVIQVISKKQ